MSCSDFYLGSADGLAMGRIWFGLNINFGRMKFSAECRRRVSLGRNSGFLLKTSAFFHFYIWHCPHQHQSVLLCISQSDQHSHSISHYKTRQMLFCLFFCNFSDIYFAHVSSNFVRSSMENISFNFK